ncbi:MAG: DNA recombination protein RmuC [Armatimonadetes bacterium]|nr:DNA recombination protein RmuC [Armatimonadota bacterium]
MDVLSLVVGVFVGLVVAIAAALVWHRKAASDWYVRIQESEDLVQQTRQELLNLSTEKATLVGRMERVDQLQQDLESSRAQYAELQNDLTKAREDLRGLESTLAERDKSFEKQSELLRESEKQLKAAFESMAHDAVQKSQETFLHLAGKQFEVFKENQQLEMEARKTAIHELVKPINEKLQTLDQVNKELEHSRTEAYATLSEQVKALAEGQVGLQKETRNLVTALKNPTRRGQWGEIQLRRVIEMSGMLRHCDFIEQASVTIEGGRLRPDVVVQLPNDRRIVIDAKVPLEAYTVAIETDDDADRKTKYADHARQIRTHIQQLSAKEYWNQFENAPEFVCMFLPGEPLYSVALEHDPELIEFGVKNNVLIATPTTLIALLRSVDAGWRQERLQESAREIYRLGKDLHNRIRPMAEHLQALGKSLNSAVNHFNKTAGSFESSVLPQARRIRDYAGITDKEIPELDAVDQRSNTLKERTMALVQGGADDVEEVPTEPITLFSDES